MYQRWFYFLLKRSISCNWYHTFKTQHNHSTWHITYLCRACEHTPFPKKTNHSFNNINFHTTSMRHFQPLSQNFIKNWYLRRVLHKQKMYHHAANWTWLLDLLSKLKGSNSTNKIFLMEFMERYHPSFTYCADAQPFMKSYNINLWQNWTFSGGQKVFFQWNIKS